MKNLLPVAILGTLLAACAEALNAEEPRLRIETRNTKGSTGNLPLLEAGASSAPTPKK